MPDDGPPLDLILEDALEQNARAEAAPEATSLDLIAAAEEMKYCKDEAERLEAEAKQYKDRYNQLRERTVPELMKKLGLLNAAGKGSFTFSGGKVHLETKIAASCTKANQETFFNWCRSNGAQDLIQETVNHNSLSAFIRERRGDALADPPGVAVFERVTAKITK